MDLRPIYMLWRLNNDVDGRPLRRQILRRHMIVVALAGAAGSV